MIENVKDGCSSTVVAAYLSQGISPNVCDGEDSVLSATFGTPSSGEGNRDVFRYLISLPTTILNTPETVSALSWSVDPYYLSALLEAGLELSEQDVSRLLEYGTPASKLAKLIVLLDHGYTLPNELDGESLRPLRDYLRDRGRTRLQ